MRALLIEQDERMEENNPREFDSVGTMAFWHNRYSLGDEQPTSDPSSYLRSLGKVITLPIYMYDHSGITISTSPFSCPWDSGYVGFIYATRQKVLDHFSKSRLSAALRDAALIYLKGEVKAYDTFLRGCCYSFVIFELTDDLCAGAAWDNMSSYEKAKFIAKHGDINESLGGFMGDTLEECGMLHEISHNDSDIQLAWNNMGTPIIIR